jgi:DNA-binding LacI/PurR family transcriptional regulator
MVSIDYLSVGSLAAQHVLALGHRSIAVIFERPWHEQRLQGFMQELAKEGIELSPDYTRSGNSNFQSGYAAARELLTLPLLPTAIFATNDLMALGALQAALDLGIAVPKCLSVLGVDNIIQGEYSRPLLTTISLPRRELGREAIELLLRCIEHPRRRALVSMLLRQEIVMRNSTGPYSMSE